MKYYARLEEVKPYICEFEAENDEEAIREIYNRVGRDIAINNMDINEEQIRIRYLEDDEGNFILEED